MGARKGEAHHLAKLTEETVRQMRRRYSEGGESHLSLAVEYDLAASTVGEVLRRLTWTHVE